MTGWLSLNSNRSLESQDFIGCNEKRKKTMALMGDKQRLFFEDNRKGIFLCLLTVVFAAYLALGGFLFLAIEGPQENVQMNLISKVKRDFTTKHSQVTAEAVDELFHDLSSKGVKGLVFNNVTAKWTYGNSVLFSATLLTTIGYGHLSPSSQLGKIICMFYTGLGIPLTLLVMAYYVERLFALSEAFKANLFRRLRRFATPLTVRMVHIIAVMAFIVVGCFVIPACVFFWLETNWTYLDALYFCFISLTTVGLGDFVPGLASRHPQVDLYRFGAAVYIIVGVSIMMFMMALTADFIQNCNKDLITDNSSATTPEKMPILPPDPPSYGSIVLQIEEDLETMGGNKNLTAMGQG